MYRLVGFGRYEIGIELCGMVACSSEDINSCARPQTMPVTSIDHLEIRGNFSAITVMPSALNKDLLLLPDDNMHFEINDSDVVLRGLQPLKSVLSFGLYGRDYDNDVL